MRFYNAVARLSVRLVLLLTLVFAAVGPVWSADSTTVTVMLRGQPDMNQAIVELIEEYLNDYPTDVKLEVLQVPGNEVYEKLQVMSASDLNLDLVHFTTPHVYPAAHNGLVENLTGWIERSPDFDLDQYYPGVIESIAYQGDVYALPFGQSGPKMLFYNADQLDAVGVPYPDLSWDWESEAIDYGRRLLQDKNGDGSPDQWAFDGNLITNNGGLDVPIIRAYGGRMWTEDGGLHLTSSEAQEAYQFLISLWNTGIFSQGVSLFDGWSNGTHAMTILGTSVVPRFRESSNFDWDAAQPPAMNGHRYTTTWAESPFGIPAHSANKQVAWDILKYIVSPRGQSKIVELGLATPIHRDVATSPVFLEDAPPSRMEMVEALAYTLPRGGDDSLVWGRIRGQYTSMLRRILAGEISPFEGMTMIQQQYEAALAESR